MLWTSAFVFAFCTASIAPLDSDPDPYADLLTPTSYFPDIPTPYTGVLQFGH